MTGEGPAWTSLMPMGTLGARAWNRTLPLHSVPLHTYPHSHFPLSEGPPQGWVHLDHGSGQALLDLGETVWGPSPPSVGVWFQ